MKRKRKIKRMKKMKTMKRIKKMTRMKTKKKRTRMTKKTPEKSKKFSRSYKNISNLFLGNLRLQNPENKIEHGMCMQKWH